MPKIIYVPQGRFAQLQPSTLLAYDINGLYTDHFSTCNILIVKSKGCVELAHIDTFVAIAPGQIKIQMQSLQDADEIILISREDVGKSVQEDLLQYFNENHANIKLTLQSVDEQHDGILLSVELNNKDELETKIKIYPKGQRPENLIHHPYEQQLEAVRKIKQIIGLRAMNANKKFPHLLGLYSIFDGQTWDHVDSEELALDVNDSITKREIDIFDKTDSYLAIVSKLNKLREEAGYQEIKSVIDMKELILPVAIHLESYLNNYDLDTIFKRNLKEWFTNKYNLPDCYPISVHDKDFKEDALKILNKEGSVFEEFQGITKEYKQNAPSTKFKDEMFNEILIFSIHYNIRKIYTDLAEHRQKEINESIKIHEQAVELSRNGTYGKAINLFIKSLKLLTYYCTSSDIKLITVYYNLGRTLFKDDDCSSAKFNLEMALELRKAFHPVDKAGIEKIERALQDCEDKLKQETIEEKITTLKM